MINSGALRLINFLNSSPWLSLSKTLLASKNVTNTVVLFYIIQYILLVLCALLRGDPALGSG